MSIESLVNHLIRPEILALNAYPVGNASGMIKLDATPFIGLKKWSASGKSV